MPAVAALRSIAGLRNRDGGRLIDLSAQDRLSMAAVAINQARRQEKGRNLLPSCTCATAERCVFRNPIMEVSIRRSTSQRTLEVSG